MFGGNSETMTALQRLAQRKAERYLYMFAAILKNQLRSHSSHFFEVGRHRSDAVQDNLFNRCFIVRNNANAGDGAENADCLCL